MKEPCRKGESDSIVTLSLAGVAGEAWSVNKGIGRGTVELRNFQADPGPPLWGKATRLAAPGESGQPALRRPTAISVAGYEVFADWIFARPEVLRCLLVDLLP